MRIARFTTGEDPLYGVVAGEVDQFGQAADDSVVVELSGDPLYVGVKPTQTEHLLADVRLLAPVIPRSKVVAIGRNYAAHAAELGHEVPAEPLMFIKPNTSVVGPGDPIFYPRQTKDLHFEGELAVVIGRLCRDVPPEQATDVIYGYTVANDVTARDLQRSDVQFTRAKSFDTFCPIGPAVAGPNEVGNPNALRIQCRVNGQPMQDSSTADMIFDVATLISEISRGTTLVPGTLIVTGTPSGVGMARTPPVFLQHGDVVEVEIDRIGIIRNHVVFE